MVDVLGYAIVWQKGQKIMEKGQFDILRFAKYTMSEIGRIEAHNERTQEEYASNPDIDTSRMPNLF